MAPLTISGVVREILTADPTLDADAVIRKALARGLTATPKAIREAVYNARSDLRKAGKAPPTAPAAAAPAPAAATPAAAKPQSVSSVVRSILAGNLDMSSDEVIRRAQARGVTASAQQIRKTTKHLRSDMKKAARKTPTQRPAPAAAREVPAPAPAPAPAPQPAPSTDLAAVLANVALVDRVVGASGGVEAARQIAEAVRACGSVDAFLQHVELVAGLRGNGAPK